LLSNRLKVLGFLALGALSGCGFAPLYGGAAGGQTSARLDEVYVPVIPDRTGQVLRESLETRLSQGSGPTEQLYQLSVRYTVNQENAGIQADSASTRTRIIGTANWQLTPIGDPAHVLLKGTSTAMNAQDIVNEQYFAVTLGKEAIDRQLADDLSAQITDQLAAWFRAHPNA
jgi:LPS-assembly lipoprotein